MQKLLLVSTCAAVLFCATVSVGADTPKFHVGSTHRVIHPAEPRNWRSAKTEALVTHIWYPVERNVPEALNEIGPKGRALFVGHPLAEDAALSTAEKKYPLLLLSHGTGGPSETLDWLAAPLAANGYVVVGVNHPGNNGLEPYTIQGFTLAWERARDLSDALDAVLKDGQFRGRIDEARIGAAGFSLGGYTVLEIAGARTDWNRFVSFCKSKEADALCRPPEMPDIVERSQALIASDPEAKASVAHAGDSYRDNRVRAVFSIAPALGEAFSASDLRDISIPVQIVAGASDTTAPIETNAKRIASLNPSLKLTILPGGVAHYTFLATCTESARKLLPPLCVDAPGVDRDAVHEQTVSMALEFFREHLK